MGRLRVFIGQTFLARPGNPMIYKSDALKTVGQITACRRIDDMGDTSFRNHTGRTRMRWYFRQVKLFLGVQNPPPKKRLGTTDLEQYSSLPVVLLVNRKRMTGNTI